VAYTNPLELSGEFWYAWQTILIVLLLLVAGPWWGWRMLLYVRKRAPAGQAPLTLDLELLLHGALAAADVMSATLVGVLFVVGRCGWRRRRWRWQWRCQAVPGS
jgi:hypothetical protein